MRRLFQIDYNLLNWSWLVDLNRPSMLPDILRPSVLTRDDAESALVAAPVVEVGGAGSSGVSPKGAEPPT